MIEIHTSKPNEYMLIAHDYGSIMSTLNYK